MWNRLARHIGIFAVLVASSVFASAAHAGYTHYYTWTVEPKADQVKLKACIADMKRLLDDNKAVIAGPAGSGSPTITATSIEFNGVGSADSHEPFYFPGEMGFNFCKTANKPYDAQVVACLYVAREHFPAGVLTIHSDGEEFDDAFEAGKAVFVKTFGHQPPDLFTGQPMDSDSSTPGASDGPSGAGDVSPDADRKALPFVAGLLVALAALVGFATWQRRRGL